MPRTVPVMGTAIPGNYETAAFWNANVAALGNFMLNKPLFSGYLSTTQVVPSSGSAFTPVVIDTETIDTDAGHSTTTNASRYFCQVAGLYRLTGSVALAAGGTGARGADFQKNGVDILGSEQIVGPAPSFVTTISPVDTFVRLAVGDYVSLAALQTSGSNMNTVMTGAAVCIFNVEWFSV